MIKLERDRSAINENFKGEKLVKLSEKVLKSKLKFLKGEERKVKFESKIWRDAKQQLLVESHDKCAYCETPTRVVAHGDVEHYRPKSIYWWQAYLVENYLASCAICNQSFKSNNFPIMGGSWKYSKLRRNTTAERIKVLARDLVPDPDDSDALAEHYEQHDLENTELINPYIDDPSLYFGWKVDTALEEVSLVPIDNSQIANICVKAAEEYYGLNRMQLRTLRYDTFNSYLVHKLTAIDETVSDRIRDLNLDQIERMCRQEASHSAVIVFFEKLGNPEDWIGEGHVIVDGTLP